MGSKALGLEIPFFTLKSNRHKILILLSKRLHAKKSFLHNGSNTESVKKCNLFKNDSNRLYHSWMIVLSYP